MIAQTSATTEQIPNAMRGYNNISFVIFATVIENTIELTVIMIFALVSAINVKRN